MYTPQSSINSLVSFYGVFFVLLSFVSDLSGTNQLFVENSCENPLLLECNEITSYDFDGIGFTQNNCNYHLNASRNLFYLLDLSDVSSLQSFELQGLAPELTYIIYVRGCQGSCLQPKYQSILEPGVQYILELLAPYNTSGTFTFTCSDTSLINVCEDASLIQCNQEYRNLDFSGEIVHYNLDCTFSSIGDTPSRWFKISGTGANTFFYVESDYPGYFDNRIALYRGDCSRLECVEDGTHSLNAFLENDVLYYLYLSPRDDEVSVHLKIECYALEVNDVCENAILVEGGDTLMGSSVTYSDEPISCDDYSTQKQAYYRVYGTGKWYQFRNSRDGGIQVSSGGCENPHCLKSSSFYFLEEGIEYTLQVSWNNTHARSYEIPVVSYPVKPVSICEDARPLTCGLEVGGSTRFREKTLVPDDCGYSTMVRGEWYSMLGDGRVLDIDADVRVNVFTGSCDSLVCERLSYQGLNMILQQGQQYYFLIYSSNILGEDYSFTPICHEIASNADCKNAVLIENDTTINGDFGASFPQFQSCNIGMRPLLFYKVKGNSNYMEIRSDASFDVIQGDCSEGVCIERDLYHYYLEKDILYTIVFYGNSLDQFEASFIFHDGVEKGSLENPHELQCGEESSYSTRFVKPTKLIVSCLERKWYPGIWFSFYGHQMIGELHLNSMHNEHRWSFFTEDEGVLHCMGIDRRNLNREYYKEVFNDSRKYYLFVYALDETAEEEFRITYDCAEPLINNMCYDAVEIDCGDSMVASYYELTSSPPTSSSSENAFFKMEGKNIFFTMEDANFEVFEGTCDAPLALNRFYGDYYFLEYDHSYYISALSSSTDSSMQAACFDMKVSNDFASAYPISCGIATYGSTKFVQSMYIESEYHGNQEIRAVFYSITGNDSLWQVVSDDNVKFMLFEEVDDSDSGLQSVFGFSRSYDEAQLIKDRKYYVVVYSPVHDIGSDFEIILNCRGAAANNQCESAIPVICGDTIRANYDRVTSSDPQCSTFSRKKNLFYSIVGDDNFINVSRVEGGALGNISVFSGCHQDSCVQGIPQSDSNPNNDSQTYFLESGVEYLLAISPASIHHQSEVSLVIDCFEGKISSPCDDLQSIACNETKYFDNYFNVKQDVGLLCGGQLSSHGSWIKLIGNDEIALIVLNQNLGAKNYLFKGDCNNLVCLGEYGSSIEYLLESNENYYLLIGDEGRFRNTEVRFNCREILNNNYCEQAQPVTYGEVDLDFTKATRTSPYCGNLNAKNLYFQIIGEDNFLELDRGSGGDRIRIQVLEGDCESFVCLPSERGFFFLKSGVSYILNFFTSRPSYDRKYTVRLISHEKRSNLSCESATPITFGDTVKGSSFFVVPNHTDSCDLFSRLHSGSFYKVQGTGEHVKVAPLGSGFRVLEGQCNALNCIGDFYGFGNEVLFLESGKEYYFVLGYNWQEYRLLLTTIDEAPNNNCVLEELPEVRCGDLVQGSFVNAWYSGVGNCGPLDYENLFYRYEGLGSFISFNKVNCRIWILENCLGDGCREVGFNQLFYFEEGQQYVFMVEKDYFSTSDIFSFEITCINSEPPNNCTTAVPLACGMEVEFDTKLIHPAPLVLEGLTDDYFRGRWFHLKGLGQSILIDGNASDGSNGFLRIFTGDCGHLSQVDSSHLFSPISFYFEDDVDYYILIELPDFASVGTYSLGVECIDEKKNTLCENAISFVCGNSSIPIYFRGHRSEPYFDQEMNQPNMFYKTVGQGDTVQFLGGFDAVEVFEGSCESSLYIEPLAPRTFFLKEGRQYLVGFYGDLLSQAGFSVRCYPINPFIDYCFLKGQPCNDYNAATTNDYYNEDCECVGYGIGIDDCNRDSIVLYQPVSTDLEEGVRLKIRSRSDLQAGYTIYNAGQEIILARGFEVFTGSEFQAVIRDCFENE